MIRETEGAVRRQVGVLFEAGTLGGWGDGALLDRFLAGRDPVAEAAFAALVERHGPMVLRACRARLGDEHEAHDAFQAVFLVLARRARSVRVRETVGPWLYGVAWRVASRARAAGQRRRRHERRAAEMARHAFEERPGDDAEAALHEEVRRLPPGFREAVILCDLEGLTTDGAAERLGLPVGTVRSRLYRGRDRLRGRLLRRGLAPAAVGATVVGASGAVPAVVVPAALAKATVGLAVGCGWAGAVPARLAWLIGGGSRVMGIKGIAAMGLSLGLAAGAGGLVAQGPGVGPGGKAEAKAGPGVAAVATEGPRPAGTDVHRLQGRWIVVEATDRGKPDPAAPLAITFRDNLVSFAREGGTESTEFTVDDRSETKSIRLEVLSGVTGPRWAFELGGRRLRMIGNADDPSRLPEDVGARRVDPPLRRYELVRDPDSTPGQVGVTKAAAGKDGAKPAEPGLPDFGFPVLKQGWDTWSARAADPATDLRRLQGGWTVTKVSSDGKEVTAAPMVLSTFSIEGNEIRILRAVGGGDAAQVARFRIEPGSRPAAMQVAVDPDQVRVVGGPAGRSAHPGWWLYAVEENRLRFAYLTGENPPRPTGFEGSGPDAQHPLEVLELVREFDQPDPPPGVLLPDPGVPPGYTTAPTHPARSAPPADVRSDHERLQGTWSVIKATLNGREFDGPNVLLAPMTFEGDEVEFGPFGDPPVTNRYRFRVDPETEPKALRLIREGARPRWWTYELKGDKLRTAAWKSLDDARRPEGFDVGGPDGALIVLELVRDPRPRRASGPVPTAEAVPQPSPTLVETPSLSPISGPVPVEFGREPASPTALPSQAGSSSSAAPEPSVAPSPNPAPSSALPPSEPMLEPQPQPPTSFPPPQPGRAIPPPAADGDLAKLQGTWTVIAREENGEEATGRDPITVVIAGNAMITRSTAAGPGDLRIETFTIDPDAQPGTIQVVPADGGRDREGTTGIYRVDDSVLLLCLGGKGRPTGFDTEPGSGRRLLVLRRKKPGRPAPAPPATPANPQAGSRS